MPHDVYDAIPTAGGWWSVLPPPQPYRYGDPPFTYTIKTIHACNCMGKCWGCGNCKCACTCGKEPRPLRPEDV